MSVKTEEQAQERELKKIEGAEPDEFVPNTNAPVVQVQPGAASLQVAGYIVMSATMVCGVMAAKRGNHWLLSEAEEKDLHLAVARVAEKYISIDLSNPLMQLAAVMGAILVPRLGVEFMNQEKDKPVAEQVPDGD
jgi:hypothetical protein